ncbi:MAG TPA: molybdopterin-guanine dinucleotide biosynthesis protein B [Candidatus Acidoferrales bacterium]|nr:molybdopterin-guanine dinucleotide biosynthesis protein B [Candidatus Acidoferrales bacterium]
MNVRPPLVAFVGTSGSGKTTAMELVTASLSRLGFKVGVAKHINADGFTIDTEGKDTWRHARAGARIIVGVSPSELAVIKKTSSETEFVHLIREFNDSGLDVVLLEGFLSASRNWNGIPKIVAAKNKPDLTRTLARTKPPILAITGQIAHAKKSSKSRAPFLDTLKDGPIITSMVRRFLRPNEMHESLKKAAVKHGDDCIGLAVGVRAAHLASSAFGLSEPTPKVIEFGSTQCIADGIKSVYPKLSIKVQKVKTDLIVFQSCDSQLYLRLLPKQKARFARSSEVLEVPDDRIFEEVKFSC